MQRLLRIYTDSFKGLSTESWMLSIVMLLNRAGSMVLPFLGVYMVDHLKFSIEDSGMVLSFFGVGSVVGSWLGGYITDKVGEFKVQAFSLFASVPMFCLLPLFDTPVSLAAMVFVQSVSTELFRPANSVAIAKYATSGNITRAFSLNRMAVNLGFSIGPALGGLLSAISYNFLFYANAAAAFIAGCTYLYFFRKRHLQFKLKKDNAATTDVEEVHPAKERSPYVDGRFIVFCLLCAAFSICFFQLLNTLPLFYKDAVQLGQSMIGILLGYSGIVVVLFEMLLVHVAERRWTITQTMVIGTVMCACSYGMLGFNHHILWLFASITLLSLGEILILPFMSTITAARAGKYNKGSYMGMNGISVAIAFIISPLLGSWIAAHYGFDRLWTGTGILLLLVSMGFYFSVNRLFPKKY